MKYDDIMRETQRQRAVDAAIHGTDSGEINRRLREAEPGFIAFAASVQRTFGRTETTYLAVPGPVPGQPEYLRGAPLSELAAKGLLDRNAEPCFIEPWMPDSWGWGEPRKERTAREAAAPALPSGWARRGT